MPEGAPEHPQPPSEGLGESGMPESGVPASGVPASGVPASGVLEATTWMETVAGAEESAASLAWKVKESLPWKPAAGV
jgi:hypothetical protein